MGSESSRPSRTTSIPPASSQLVARGGDDGAGFEVRVDAARRILRATSWGLWTRDLARQYRAAFDVAFETLRGGPWDILSDRRRLLAQSDEVQAVMSEIMRDANRFGRRRAAVLVENPIASLQIKRLGKDASVVEQRTFREEREALAWLRAPE